MRWSWPESRKHVWNAARSLLHLGAVSDRRAALGSGPYENVAEPVRQEPAAPKSAEEQASGPILGDVATAALDEILEQTQQSKLQWLEMDLEAPPSDTPN